MIEVLNSISPVIHAEREREREKSQAKSPLVSFLPSWNLTSVFVHSEGFSTGTIWALFLDNK